MVIKLMDLTKWRVLEEGQMIHFEKSTPRTVRIDVNAPDAIKVFAKETETPEQEIFVANVYGRDTLEFSVNGAFDLTAVGGEMWWYTIDGQNLAMDAVDDRSFTRVVERRQRNPELEYMMQMMQLNMERRLAHVAQETELRVARRIARERDGTREDTAQRIVPAESSGKAAGDSKPADGKANGDEGKAPDGTSKDPAKAGADDKK